MRRLISTVLVLCFLSIGQAAAAQQAVGAEDVRPEEAYSWLAERRRELRGMLADGRRADLAAGLAASREASLSLARADGLTDRRLGYIVYPPRTTLSLFLLDRMQKMYAAALRADRADEIPAVSELFSLAGERLEPTVPAKYPTLRRVRAALDGMAVPPSALRGYRVFLLPFAMGEVSGQGGPGFAFLAAEPVGERLIPCQLEVTLTHEFGHYLHLVGMPRMTSAGRIFWARYLALRDLTWREDGPVGTWQWKRSPEETFAEDFRLLCGGQAARGEPSIAAAGNPSLDADLPRIERFMRELADSTEVPRHWEPWPEGAGGDVGPAGMAAAFAALLAMFPLGYVAGKAGRQGAAGRPLTVRSSS